MTCMAGAGRRGKENWILLQNDSRVKTGLFFVQFFGAAFAASGMGQRDRAAACMGREGRRNMPAWEGCHGP